VCEEDHSNDLTEKKWAKTELSKRSDLKKIVKMFRHTTLLLIVVLSEEDLERLGRDDIDLLYKSRQKIDPLEQIEQQYSSKTNY